LKWYINLAYHQRSNGVNVKAGEMKRSNVAKAETKINGGIEMKMKKINI